MPSDDGNFSVGRWWNGLGIELHFPISQVAIDGQCARVRTLSCQWAFVRRNNVCADVSRSVCGKGCGRTADEQCRLLLLSCVQVTRMKMVV